MDWIALPHTRPRTPAEARERSGPRPALAFTQQSPVRLTRQEILFRWPADHPDQGDDVKK